MLFRPRPALYLGIALATALLSVRPARAISLNFCLRGILETLKEDKISLGELRFSEPELFSRVIKILDKHFNRYKFRPVTSIEESEVLGHFFRLDVYDQTNSIPAETRLRYLNSAIAQYANFPSGVRKTLFNQFSRMSIVDGEATDHPSFSHLRGQSRNNIRYENAGGIASPYPNRAVVIARSLEVQTSVLHEAAHLLDFKTGERDQFVTDSLEFVELFNQTRWETGDYARKSQREAYAVGMERFYGSEESNEKLLRTYPKLHAWILKKYGPRPQRQIASKPLLAYRFSPEITAKIQTPPSPSFPQGFNVHELQKLITEKTPIVIHDFYWSRKRSHSILLKDILLERGQLIAVIEDERGESRFDFEKLVIHAVGEPHPPDAKLLLLRYTPQEQALVRTPSTLTFPKGLGAEELEKLVQEKTPVRLSSRYGMQTAIIEDVTGAASRAVAHLRSKSARTRIPLKELEILGLGEIDPKNQPKLIDFIPTDSNIRVRPEVRTPSLSRKDIQWLIQEKVPVTLYKPWEITGHTPVVTVEDLSLENGQLVLHYRQNGQLNSTNSNQLRMFAIGDTEAPQKSFEFPTAQKVREAQTTIKIPSATGALTFEGISRMIARGDDCVIEWNQNGQLAKEKRQIVSWDHDEQTGLALVVLNKHGDAESIPIQEIKTLNQLSIGEPATSIKVEFKGFVSVPGEDVFVVIEGREYPLHWQSKDTWTGEAKIPNQENESPFLQRSVHFVIKKNGVEIKRTITEASENSREIRSNLHRPEHDW